MSYEQIKEAYAKIAKDANDLLGVIGCADGSIDDICAMTEMNLVELRDHACRELGKLDLFVGEGSFRWVTVEEFNLRMKKFEETTSKNSEEAEKNLDEKGDSNA